MGATTIVSVALGAIYAFAGFVKVFPFPKPAYDQQVKDFRNYATVFPLGIKPDPTTYRIVTGIAEIGLGAGLILTGLATRRLCCMGLMVIMVGAAYTQFQLQKTAMAAVPAAFFLALLWLYNNLV